MDKILILAGEESGVLYAKAIADEVRRLNDKVEIRGYGDYGFKTSDLAVFGFWEVVKRLFFFMRVKRTMERAIVEWHPDVVCTIDYPGMNLKLAAFAKQHGVRAVHVVCPQVWAWKAGRIPKIEAALDKLCCFFPFEPSLFKPGFAEFVGHPLADQFYAETSAANAKVMGKPLVALLPGSRLGEIKRHLPTLLAAVARFDVRVVIPAANGRARRAIERIIAAKSKVAVEVTDGGARNLLRCATCAAVASGTATLEASLARCPTVLVYKVDALLAAYLRRMITGVKHVGLANVIWEKSGATGEAPMPELLQEQFTVDNVAHYFNVWLTDETALAQAKARLEAAMELLRSDGSAMRRIAQCLG